MRKRGGKRRRVACPHCGHTFPAGRLSCPECGSDAETGWKSPEEIDYESVELPEWDEGPGAEGEVRRAGRLGLVLLLVLVLVLLGFCF
jgi:hypothetical protein